MRTLLRAATAIVGLALVAAVAAALLVPRLLDSEALRERVRVAAEDALGRGLDYGALGFGLFPPAVVVEDIRVAGETAESPPLLEGERLALRISLLPLLARILVVDSVSLRGVTARLVRTEDGFVLPSRASDGDAADRVAASDGAEQASSGEGAGLDLAVARVELEDARLVVLDRSVSPAVTWELRELSASARGTARDAPVALEFAGSLASGGRVRGEGEFSLGGAVDLTLVFDEVAVAPLGAYLGSGSKLAGSLSGTAVASGTVAKLESLHAEALLADGRFSLDDMTIVGPAKLVADLHGPVAALRGSFAIDATDAEIRYGGMFSKPPGDAATVEGRLVDGADGSTAIDDVHVTLRNFKGTASLEGGARPRVTVNAPPFELRGWEALVPALADYRPSGPIGFEALELRPAPLELRGRIVLSGVRATLPEAGEVVLRGAVVGMGKSIVSDGLLLVVADQKVAIDARISELDGALRFQLKSRASDADANRLVTTFASKPDFAFGRLSMFGDLQGSLAGSRPPLETLAGNARVEMGAGRLAGVSLLKLTVDRFEGLGSLALVASRLFGGPNLDAFYGDEFLGITGSFEVDGGVIETRDLRLVYPDYFVDLRGTLALHDLGIDMRGVLSLGEELAATLGRDELPPESNRIALARVTGTLDDPEVRISREVAAAFLRHSGLQEKAGQAIGDAVGGEVGDLLGDLLGGAGRR